MKARGGVEHGPQCGDCGGCIRGIYGNGKIG